ncbi:unnamed protein product [Candidula unifasciata]|uniref:Uncharacterized protein n=1 Tax=Candidula unifasciata TaxID=100452 RepID=A0A8S4AAW3_9EUPU|nr:unnamed protein product [Candidula unifasciata]
MTGETVDVQRESFWKQHQNTLVQLRQDLSSGRRRKPNLSPTVSTAPVTSKTTFTKKSQHPPFGKYRRTPPPYLPKLKLPDDRDKKSLASSPTKFRVVPPVKPKQAFVADYDSWGEETDDEEEDYADDSSDKRDGRHKPTGGHAKSGHLKKPRKHYKPKPHPQTPSHLPPSVVYGAPFPVYYPPPPKHASRRRIHHRKKPDRRRKSQQPLQPVSSSRIPVSKKKRARLQTVGGAHTAPATAVRHPQTCTDDDGEEEDGGQADESAHAALLYMKHHPLFANDFTDWFVQDCLHTELLPDFLIETFTEIRHMPYNHRLYVPTLYCCEDILADHVSEMITSIVHETVTEMAYDYIDLQRDPLEEFLTTLIEDVVMLGVREIVRSSVVELAEQYMKTQFAIGIMHGLVDEHLDEIKTDLLEEVQFDLAAETVIMSEVIGPEVKEEAQLVAAEVLQNYDNKVMRRQLREVKHLADLKLADGMVMEFILSVISQQGQLWTEDDHLDRHLDDLIFNESFHQIFTISKERNKTVYCKPLHKLHEKAVSDVALDVFLQQLSRSLDEDLADVDEYERGVTVPVSHR